MQITLELSEATLETLRRAAEMRGLDANRYAATLLEKAVQDDASLLALVVPPPDVEPDWVKELVASKPHAADALANWMGALADREPDRPDAAEVLQELRRFTRESKKEEPV